MISHRSALMVIAQAFVSAGCPPAPATTTEGSATGTSPSTAEATQGGSDSSMPGSSSSTTGSSSSGEPTTGMPTACGVCPKTHAVSGSFVIPGDEENIDFTCVSEIDGDLSFLSVGWPTTPFASLRRVSGTLKFNLLSGGYLDFLPCLESVGSLVFEYADESLTDLSGLEGLKTIEDLLQLNSVPALTSLTGLDGLSTGPKRVEVNDAGSLMSLDALLLPANVESVVLRDVPNLQQLTFLTPVETIGTLTLARLPSLISLSGASHIQSAGRLEIGVCPGAEAADSLTDLAGLDSLAEVDVLSIAGNASLTALSGAPKLTTMNQVVIVENPKLPPAAITAFLAQNTNPDAVTCFGEASDCVCP